MKLPKEDREKFHLHSMITLNMLMEAIINESGLPINEVTKFVDIVKAAFDENCRQLTEIQDLRFNFTNKN